MRVLFATNRFPGALTRGDQLRAYQQIRHLAPRHAITLLCFEAPTPGVASQQDLARWCERVVLVPRSRLAVAARAAAAVMGPRPLQAAMFDAAPAQLETLLREGRFDLAHVQLARLGGLVQRLAPLPCVLDFVDALSLNMARRAQYDRTPIGWIAGLEARRLAAYERALLGQVAGATISSANDRDAIGDFANLHLAGNGVDLDRFARQPFAGRAQQVAFIGNLGYFPNVDAVRWFVTAAWPKLLAAAPETRLLLVGARPSRLLRRLAATHAGIDLIGEVPDVRPYLAQAAVAIAPLRAGSGQQLKILEAMAAGTPVVATGLSARGIGARDGEQLLIADDGAATARAIARLLHDPALAESIAQRARAFVESHFSWQRSAADLEQVWQAAANRAAAVR